MYVDGISKENLKTLRNSTLIKVTPIIAGYWMLQLLSPNSLLTLFASRYNFGIGATNEQCWYKYKISWLVMLKLGILLSYFLPTLAVASHEFYTGFNKNTKQKRVSIQPQENSFGLNCSKWLMMGMKGATIKVIPFDHQSLN